MFELFVLKDKSIARIYDTGDVYFFPNLKIWRKPKFNGRFYVWEMKTPENAKSILNELNKLL